MRNFLKIMALLSATLTACGGDPSGGRAEDDPRESVPGDENPGGGPNGDTPVVSSSNPLSGDTGIGAGESFEVTLGDKINPESGRVILVGLSQTLDTTSYNYARHPFQKSYDEATNKLSITPLVPLQMNTTYRLIFEAFEDQNGNALQTETIELTTAKLIPTLTRQYSGGGNMYTYRTTTVEDGDPDTTRVYSGKGGDGQWQTEDDVLQSYHLFTKSFTTDRTVKFHAGNDGIWFTSDDNPFVIEEKKRLDDGSLVYVMKDGPGADATWFTEDDASDYYTVLSFNDAGLREMMRGFETGADHVPETADDALATYTQFIYDDSWLVGIYYAQSAGGDGNFETGDDVGYLRVIHRDDHGLVLQVDQFENVMRSNLALLTGNLMHATEFNYENFRATESIKVDGKGADNEWLTEDDDVNYQEQYLYDEQGCLSRSIRIGAGDDGKLGTGDDYFLYYSDLQYDASGNEISRQSYSGFGGDEFPFTEDDVRSSDSEYLIIAD